MLRTKMASQCWQSLGQRKLTIPYCFHGKSTFFFNKRGGDDIYNDEVNVCLLVCHKRSPLSQVVSRWGLRCVPRCLKNFFTNKECGVTARNHFCFYLQSKSTWVTKNVHFLKQRNPDKNFKEIQFFGGRACLSVCYVSYSPAEREKTPNVPTLTVSPTI